MADKLDLSLDDIIKQSRKLFGLRGGRGNRGNTRGVRGRGFGSQRRGEGNGLIRGGVNQRSRRPAPYQKVKELPDFWQHDMYDGSVGGGYKQFTGGVQSSSGKLLVSNLDFGVNDSDIQELFSDFGQLTKAAVHYDRSGRSLGTAQVIYARRTDAIKALKQYNNVPLDGRAMNIQLVGSDGNQLGGTPGMRGGLGRSMQRGGGVVRARGQGRGAGSQRGGRGRGRGGRYNGNAPTIEELDAQLDAYNSKMDIE